MPVQVLERDARPRRPFVFHFQGLEPATSYTMTMNGVCKYNNRRR